MTKGTTTFSWARRREMILITRKVHLKAPKNHGNKHTHTFQHFKHFFLENRAQKKEEKKKLNFGQPAPFIKALGHNVPNISHKIYIVLDSRRCSKL
jgi:hypothetical protein